MPMSPYGWSKLMTEMMLRDAGARARPRPRDPALLQRRRRRSEDAHRPVDAGRDASDQGRGARPRSAGASGSTCSAPTIRRRTAPASATTSTSPISRARIAPRSTYLRAGGDSATLNCGYGRGYSVLRGDRGGAARRSAAISRCDMAPRRAGRSGRRSWPPPTASASVLRLDAGTRRSRHHRRATRSPGNAGC